jgi:hypothetical protein
MNTTQTDGAIGGPRTTTTSAAMATTSTVTPTTIAPTTVATAVTTAMAPRVEGVEVAVRDCPASS